MRAGSQGSGGRGFGGSGSFTGPGSFFRGGSPMVAPGASGQFGNSRFDQFLDEPHGYWFRERQPDCPLRHFVSLQVAGQLPLNVTGHRIQAAVVLERGVPDEWPVGELERGDPITERLLRARGDRTNRGPNLLEGRACLGRRGREVGTHRRDHTAGNSTTRVSPTGSACHRASSVPRSARTREICASVSGWNVSR